MKTLSPFSPVDKLVCAILILAKAEASFRQKRFLERQDIGSNYDQHLRSGGGGALQPIIKAPSPLSSHTLPVVGGSVTVEMILKPTLDSQTLT